LSNTQIGRQGLFISVIPDPVVLYSDSGLKAGMTKRQEMKDSNLFASKAQDINDVILFGSCV
jgi:hypothetical protein